jgi:hypothetical protein
MFSSGLAPLLLFLVLACGGNGGEGELPPAAISGISRMQETCTIMFAEAEDLNDDDLSGLVTDQFRERFESAKDDYTSASAKFNAWVSGLRLALTSGSPPEETAQLKEALEEGDRFIVEANVLHLHMHGVSPGPGAAVLVPLLQSILDAGVQIWESHNESQRQNREAIAEELRAFSCPRWPGASG